MKLRLSLGLIGCTLMTILAPSIQPAQASLDFGTSRQLRTCPSRSGRLTVEQVKKYVACYYEEKAPYEASVKFVDVLSVQIAPKPRRVRYNEFRLHQIDIEKPIYEIRGSLIVYECRNITEGYPRGQNCSVFREPRSTGKCYQTTFGDWYCMMGGSASLLRPERKMPAPGGQETSSSGKPENNEPEPEQTTRIKPNSAVDYNDSGVSKYNRKDIQGALTDFNMSIKIDSNNARAYVNRAILKSNYLNDIQGALADFNQAIRIAPDYAIAYRDRSILKKRYLNDIQGALFDLKRAFNLFQKEGNTEEYRRALEFLKEWS